MARMALSRRRLVTGLAGITAVAGAGAGLVARNARYYDGPASDHFNGLHFFDPNGSAPKGFGDLLRWQMTRERVAWPEKAPSPYADKPPQRVDNPRDWRISFVGHASLLLQAAGLNILLDPVWSERASPLSFAGPKRVNDPGVAFDVLPPIDVALVSHCHYDHLDVTTLAALATPHRSRIVTPLGNDTIIRSHDPAARVEAYDWHVQVPLSRDVSVTMVPTRHWSARGLFDRNKALWAGFVIETPAGRILHVADSGYGDGHHFRNVRDLYGPFRLAILPIGAYAPRWFMRDQHMNPREAVRAFADTGAERALAHHFGTFQLTDEAIDEPVARLVEARKTAGLPEEKFPALRPGQVVEL
jgi:L-ascorbate metabolism protein UlaG (beta-lactamase superfamily)